MRTCVSIDNPPARVALIQSRIQHLSAQSRSNSAERVRYLDLRRLFAWDAWAQAAMGAEDLEILVSGLQGWRAGKDLIDALQLVDARGPAFFGELQGEWSKRLAEIIRFPGPADLRAIMVPAKADLLVAGLRDSVRQACDDFLAVESLVPWDIRDAMLSFKHGLLWLVPASAPIETDAIGLTRIDKGRESSFVIWRRGKIGTLFGGLG